jgi:hypothetical protein
LRHETGRRYNSQQRVAHANKRFRPAQVEGLAADLGLVPQLQPPGPERFSHVFGWRVEIGVAVLKPAREMGIDPTACASEVDELAAPLLPRLTPLASAADTRSDFKDTCHSADIGRPTQL